MPVNVRPAIPEDILRLIELERLSPGAAHWSEEHYRRAVQGVGELPERVVLVAESEDLLHRKVKTRTLSQKRRQGWGNQQEQGRGTPVGFLVARHAESEWELENVVVGLKFRGQGIGMQLMEALLARVRSREGRAIFLEVRESNVAARKLYERAGFRECGRRKNYYSDPVEDAILYSKKFV